MGHSKIHINPEHRGQLHRDLGYAPGNKIPVAALEKAKRSRNPAIRKRANFALNFGGHNR